MLDNTTKYLIRIYREKKYEIGYRQHKVDGHSIIQNRNLICDCTNTNKTDNKGMCSHKLFILFFPFLDNTMKQIKEMNDYLEIKKSFSEDPNTIQYVLDKLRDIKMGR